MHRMENTSAGDKTSGHWNQALRRDEIQMAPVGQYSGGRILRSGLPRFWKRNSGAPPSPGFAARQGFIRPSLKAADLCHSGVTGETIECADDVLLGAQRTIGHQLHDVIECLAELPLCLLQSCQRLVRA